MKKTYLFLLVITLCCSCSYLPEEVEVASEINLVETPNYISLSPQALSVPSVGILFYPGGLVDPHVYLEPFQELVALDKYKLVILKVAGNLAILNSGKAFRFKDDFEEIDNWIIGGHSLGGVVACMDVAAHPDAYRALFLMGAYSSSDLSGWAGPVLSLTAEFDGLTTSSDVNDNANQLPPALTITDTSELPATGTSNQSVYYQIKGANHAQFGAYGTQEKDGNATINATTQQSEVRNVLRAFLNVNNL